MLLRNVTLGAVVLTAVTAWALDTTPDTGEKKCAGCPSAAANTALASASCCDGAGKKCCDKECGGCPVETAMQQLPQITFVVGEEKVHCPMSAEKLAEEHGATVKFAVGEQQYDEKPAAMQALLVALNEKLDEMVTPHTCNVSGKTTLAGKSLSCCKTADKYATKMKEAVQQVSLVHMVGDQECCSRSAPGVAAEKGLDIVYVVGEEKTACHTTASVKLARAKIRAALMAMMQAENEVQASTEASEVTES